MISTSTQDVYSAMAAFVGLTEALRKPINQPYWLRMQGHHGKGSTRWGRKPSKPFRKSAAARKVYRGDVTW